MSYFYRQLIRVMKPGCVVVVHVAQIPRMKRAGGRGLADFRGMNIRLAERAGLIYEYDWLIRKNPQAQAIRTRSRELQFSGLESDRRKSRGTLGDYLLKFIAPGDAPPVNSTGEVSRNDWIAWAESAWWNDIIETDTLNLEEARGPEDTRHICPLQLEVYRRIILLYTNPGEIVLEPFGGFGSGSYVALGGVSPKTKKRILNPRRVVSIELKDEYYRAKLVNIQRAINQHKQLSGGKAGASRSGSILDACEAANV